MADDDAIIELKAPGGGARGGRDDEGAPSSADDDDDNSSMEGNLGNYDNDTYRVSSSMTYTHECQSNMQ